MPKPLKTPLRKAVARQDKARAGKSCRWFVLCTNKATTTRDHPILGKVPICRNCDKRLEELGR